MLKEMVGKFRLRKTQNPGKGAVRLLEAGKKLDREAAAPKIVLSDNEFDEY